ncbi:MAG: hypothetical protein Q9212_000039 [Teloschistes hypoglaucus]
MLKCIGGTAKGLYDVDIMRCKNQGSDYGDEDIQWTCTASLPSEFKLGSTDVICEGYESSSDPYVLTGSCGVEYRLILTDVGEQRYGRKAKSKSYHDDSDESGGSTVGSILFGMVFLGVLGWIIYSALYGNREPLPEPQELILPVIEDSSGNLRQENEILRLRGLFILVNKASVFRVRVNEPKMI